MLKTQDFTTVIHEHEKETNDQQAQELLQPPTPEQRVISLPQHTDTDMLQQSVVSPVKPATEGMVPPSTQEPLPLPIQQNALPEILFTAPNVPFPKIPSSSKTRPVPPLTRSRATAGAAATTASLNLSPDGSQLTYAKAIRGDEKAQWRKAEEEEFDRLFLSKTMTPSRRGLEHID